MILRLLDSLLPTRVRPAPALESAADRSVLVDRGVAAAIDLVVCYVLVEAPALYALDALLAGGLAALGAAAPALSLLALLPVYVTYSFGFEWRFGRTPGKVNRGLVVVTEDGRPCSLWPAAVRNLLRYVDLVGVPPLVVGLASALVSGGRRVGDHAAGTVVVRARAPADDTLADDATTDGGGSK